MLRVEITGRANVAIRTDHILHTGTNVLKQNCNPKYPTKEPSTLTTKTITALLFLLFLFLLLFFYFAAWDARRLRQGRPPTEPEAPSCRSADDAHTPFPVREWRSPDWALPVSGRNSTTWRNAAQTDSM